MSKTHYIVHNKSACALANFGDAMAHHHSTPNCSSLCDADRNSDSIGVAVCIYKYKVINIAVFTPIFTNPSAPAVESPRGQRTRVLSMRRLRRQPSKVVGQVPRLRHVGFTTTICGSKANTRHVAGQCSHGHRAQQRGATAW